MRRVLVLFPGAEPHMHGVGSGFAGGGRDDIWARLVGRARLVAALLLILGIKAPHLRHFEVEAAPHLFIRSSRKLDAVNREGLFEIFRMDRSHLALLLFIYEQHVDDIGKFVRGDDEAVLRFVSDVFCHAEREGIPRTGGGAALVARVRIEVILVSWLLLARDPGFL